jgi:hypothetical protein
VFEKKHLRRFSASTNLPLNLIGPPNELTSKTVCNVAIQLTRGAAVCPNLDWCVEAVLHCTPAGTQPRKTHGCQQRSSSNFAPFRPFHRIAAALLLQSWASLTQMIVEFNQHSRPLGSCAPKISNPSHPVNRLVLLESFVAAMSHPHKRGFSHRPTLVERDVWCNPSSPSPTTALSDAQSGMRPSCQTTRPGAC